MTLVFSVLYNFRSGRHQLFERDFLFCLGLFCLSWVGSELGSSKFDSCCYLAAGFALIRVGCDFLRHLFVRVFFRLELNF